GDLGVEVVHEHPHGGLGAPGLACAFVAAGGADSPGGPRVPRGSFLPADHAAFLDPPCHDLCLLPGLAMYRHRPSRLRTGSRGRVHRWLLGYYNPPSPAKGRSAHKTHTGYACLGRGTRGGSWDESSGGGVVERWTHEPRRRNVDIMRWYNGCYGHAGTDASSDAAARRERKP